MMDFFNFYIDASSSGKASNLRVYPLAEFLHMMKSNSETRIQEKFLNAV